MGGTGVISPLPVNRSSPMGLLLVPVFQEFIKMTNYDVEHVIKKEMSGDVRDAFVAIGNWRGPKEGARGQGQEWGH